jgi:hypothetical protein
VALRDRSSALLRGAIKRGSEALDVDTLAEVRAELALRLLTGRATP